MLLEGLPAQKRRRDGGRDAVDVRVVGNSEVADTVEPFSQLSRSLRGPLARGAPLIYALARL